MKKGPLENVFTIPMTPQYKIYQKTLWYPLPWTCVHHWCIERLCRLDIHAPTD